MFDKYEAIIDKAQKLATYDQHTNKTIAGLNDGSNKVSDSKTKQFVVDGAKKQDTQGLFNVIRESLANDLHVDAIDSPMERYVYQVNEISNQIPGAAKSRVATTNFDWSDAVKKSVSQLSADGKMFVLGGALHFNNKTSGYADELAGMPSIAFKAASKNHPANSYSKSTDSDYDYAIYLNDKSGALKDMEQSLKPFDLPFKPSANKAKE